MEYEYSGATILDIYHKDFRDMLFSMSNPFDNAGEYLRKTRKAHKAKSVLDATAELTGREKDETVSELLTFMPKGSDIYSFKEAYKNIYEWGKGIKESNFKDFFGKIGKTFNLLPRGEQLELLKITFSKINAEISTIRNALSSNIMESGNIELLFVIDQALQICSSLSQIIIEDIKSKKTTKYRREEIESCSMYLLILLMRIESIRREESTIDDLYSDIALTTTFIDKFKLEEKYEISRDVYSVLEVA